MTAGADADKADTRRDTLLVVANPGTAVQALLVAGADADRLGEARQMALRVAIT